MHVCCYEQLCAAYYPHFYCTYFESQSIVFGYGCYINCNCFAKCCFRLSWFFNASGTNIGNGTLTAGVATFTTSTLPIGTTGLYAIYQGDLTYIGSTAITINHTVNSTPTISTHPSPVTSAVGCDPAFSVTASSTLPLTYQWLFNGNPIDKIARKLRGFCRG